MKPVQHAFLDEISDKFESGSCRVKNRSQGQILGKPCVSSEGHIFSLIIMKLDQHVCQYEISHKFGNGSCWVQN